MNWFVSVLYPVICLGGLAGNILVIALMTRKKLRAATSSLFLASLAVVDICILVLTGTQKWLSESFDVNIPQISDAHCRGYVFLGRTLQTLEAWIVVTIALERLIAVVRSNVVRQWFSPRRAGGAVVAIVACCFVLHAPKLIIVSLDIKNGTKMCSPNKEYAYFAKFLRPTDIILSLAVPYIFLICCNIATVVKVIVTQRAVAVSNNVQEQAREKKTRNLTLTLVLVTSTYLALTFPRFGFILYIRQLRPAGHAARSLVTFVWFRITSETLILLNSAINILLYILAGSKYRKEFLRMCRCFKGYASPSMIGDDDL